MNTIINISRHLLWFIFSSRIFCILGFRWYMCLSHDLSLLSCWFLYLSGTWKGVNKVWVKLKGVDEVHFSHTLKDVGHFEGCWTLWNVLMRCCCQALGRVLRCCCQTLGRASMRRCCLTLGRVLMKCCCQTLADLGVGEVLLSDPWKGGDEVLLSDTLEGCWWGAVVRHLEGCWWGAVVRHLDRCWWGAVVRHFGCRWGLSSRSPAHYQWCTLKWVVRSFLALQVKDIPWDTNEYPIWLGSGGVEGILPRLLVSSAPSSLALVAKGCW